MFSNADILSQVRNKFYDKINPVVLPCTPTSLVPPGGGGVQDQNFFNDTTSLIINLNAK